MNLNPLISVGFLAEVSGGSSWARSAGSEQRCRASHKTIDLYQEVTFGRPYPVRIFGLIQNWHGSFPYF